MGEVNEVTGEGVRCKWLRCAANCRLLCVDSCPQGNK